jgi:hypothetical protein
MASAVGLRPQIGMTLPGDCPAPKPSSRDADNVPAQVNWPDEPKESPSMNDAIPQIKQQPVANLDALHRQLKEMAVRTKDTGSTEREQRQEIRGPVLVIGGK